MKKNTVFSALMMVVCLDAAAQHQNYFSLETGAYFGKANSNITSSMKRSGLGDYYTSNSGWLDILLGLGGVDGQYPRERTGKLKYKFRAGHYFTPKTALEAGFGLTYYGSVEGYDQMPITKDVNRLWIQSWINTLYIACVRNNEQRTAGVGAGPALAFYKLTSVANNGSEQTKTHFLPGGMITGFWNFLSTKSLFIGLRTECSLTRPARISEIKVVNRTDPSFVSTFQSTKTGSLNGSITLQAGIRF